MATAAAADQTRAPFLMLPLKQLRPSPLNPRKHFDETKLQELAATFGNGVGVIEPLVARPSNGHYEIVCGERRHRAATIAKLEEVPVIVRDLTDPQVLEIMVIENDQREGVNPLERAEGYKRLLKFGFDIDKMAARLGHSRKWIYDQIKLLDLIPAAQQLLVDHRITAGHAILLARLTPAQQKVAIDPNTYDAVFQYEDADLYRPDDEDAIAARRRDPYAGKKAGSVRELQAWIDNNCRLDPAAADQEVFPELAAVREQAEHVVHLTFDYHADKKTHGGEKLYLRDDWKRADGVKASKTCASGVTGVIVIGPGRGEAFKVCVDRDCKVHWSKEKKAQAKQQAQRAERSEPSAAQKRQQQEHQRYLERQKKEEADRKRYHDAGPAIVKAALVKVQGAKLDVLMQLASRRFPAQHLTKAKVLIGKVKTADDVLRLFAITEVVDIASNAWISVRDMPKVAKSLGVDLKPLLKTDTASAQAQPKKKTAKAKSGKKR